MGIIDESGRPPAPRTGEDALLEAFTGAVFLGPARELEAWCAGIFWIVTAHNPGGRICSAAANVSADLRMQAELAQLERLPVEGCSPDLAHREAGWAVRFPSRAAALDLARRFGQRALYEVRDDGIRLIDLEGKWPEQFLGKFRERLR